MTAPATNAPARDLPRTSLFPRASEDTSGLIDLSELGDPESIDRNEPSFAPLPLPSHLSTLPLSPVAEEPVTNRLPAIALGLSAVSLIVSIVALLVGAMSADARASTPAPGSDAAAFAAPSAGSEEPEIDATSSAAPAAEAAPEREAPAPLTEPEASAPATAPAKTAPTRAAPTRPTRPASTTRPAASTPSGNTSSQSAEATDADDGDLDALLDRALGGGTATAEPSGPALPDLPRREQVLSSLRSVSSEVARCEGSGIVDTFVVVDGATGRVKRAIVTGDHAGTPTAVCVASAVRQVRFPRFARPELEVTFPYRL